MTNKECCRRIKSTLPADYDCSLASTVALGVARRISILVNRAIDPLLVDDQRRDAVPANPAKQGLDIVLLVCGRRRNSPPVLRGRRYPEPFPLLKKPGGAGLGRG